MALTVASLCLLAGGYAASQWAFFAGRTAEYASKIDAPAVKWLSLTLLLCAVAMAYIREKDQDGAET